HARGSWRNMRASAYGGTGWKNTVGWLVDDLRCSRSLLELASVPTRMASARSLWFKLQDVVRGLPAVSPLSAVVALRQPKLLPVFHANVLRSYRVAKGGRAPSVLPHALLPVRAAIDIRLGEYGLFPGKEADYPILELVALLKPERVFEIGTSTGR